ncbi:hypothetical protein E1B28_004740 [Marasmius oreades]|uniref:RRM domain-containing protein n=1 Tax=Marasmius oreades TaxID=181124 RepID=A0A9P7UZ80_9AGAR|nr:uncharacterized protein E1B28_004740 [Marasmius oreades]KAG7097390.1 hypothetical protein E1B28_004740 [Marasmius oreades]
MSTQPHMLHRSGSPSDNAHLPTFHHIQSPDSSYPLRPLQNGLYSLNGSNNVGHMAGEFPDRMSDVHKTKLGGLSNSAQRQSFTAIPNATRSSRNITTSTSTIPSGGHALFRDNPTSNGHPAYFPSSDIYPSHLTSPTQSQLQPFDPRSTFDFAGPGSTAVNGGGQQKSPYPLDPYIPNNSFSMGSGKPLQGQPPVNQPQMNGFIGRNGLQLSSQTPYGPHIATNIGASNGSIGNSNGIPGPNAVTQEEISTIFVVGFPDDMQEREFQNMFTFSTGFEAATLKIPNKEYTSYGTQAGTATGPSNLRSNGPGTFGYQGPNDPYNLVTVNQGGVVVDGGRDGTMTSWPAPPIDDGAAGNSHFFGGGGGANGPPRKQIIGFAKFRTREEAIVARDMLQGRRVDIEKGAVLKAEMAKKNLHTKRGVGPVAAGGIMNAANGLGPSPGNGALASAQGLGLAPGAGTNLSMLQQPQFGGGEMYTNEALNIRDREMATMNAMGLTSNVAQSTGRPPHWQHQEPQNLSTCVPRDREEEDRQRDILGAMGLAGSARTARDDEAERDARRAQQKDALRLRSGSAFEAFHSVPSQQPPRPLQPLDQADVNLPGPWDGLRHEAPRVNTAGILSSSSGRSSPSAATINPAALPFQGAPSRRRSPPSDFLFQSEPEYHNASHEQNACVPPDSCSSSVTDHSRSGASSSSRTGSDSENELVKAVGELAVSTENGNTSPQLPSPASGTSSGSTRNRVDQNPPINTLYVGNLPTTPPPMGNDVLEGSLRELFRVRPGYRRLSFKQKTSGPMCFVEFEDVNAACKTITELSGHTLNGLVKNGGIRLSYSRNPLGVRTPTSASAPGSVLQQQQQQPPQCNIFGPSSAPSQNAHAYMMSPPPPRFSTTPSSPYGGTSAFVGVPTPYFGNNGVVNFGGHRLTSSNEPNQSALSGFSPFELANAAHSTIPEQSTDSRRLEQPSHDHIPRPLSPPSRTIEPARAA